MAQRESNQGRRSRGWLVGLAILAALVVLFIVLKHAMHTDVTVRAATVQYQNISRTVSTNGVVEPVNAFVAYAPMPTVIDNLYVKVGQQVKQGQELLRLDDSDARKGIAAAQAELQSDEAALHNIQNGGTHAELLTGKSDLQAAQAQVQQNRTSLQSLQGLQAAGDASANEVAAAQLRLSQAEARVTTLETSSTQRFGAGDLATARAQVAQARASLQAAESALGTLDIHSPVAGTVYAVPYPQYHFVQPGQDLVSVADLDHVQVKAYFDEPEIGNLADGQAVTIVWDAKPNRVWHGHIVQSPTSIINYGTRNVGTCLISVDDAQGDLLPNTNVTVTVTTLQKFHVMSIPREALRTDGSTNFVYKIVNGHLVKTSVQVGVVTLTDVQIASGLQENDTVALGATTDVDLSNGEPVKVLQ